MKNRIILILFATVMVIAIGSSFFGNILKSTESSVLASEAWRDGFEVIVESKTGAIKLMHLADAMKSINTGSSVLLNPIDKGHIVAALISDRKKFHHYENSEGYPFVELKIDETKNSGQHVTYSVHYSLRTFEYSYNAYNDKIEPLYYSASEPGGKSTRFYK